jgi:hypothetical protein
LGLTVSDQLFDCVEPVISFTKEKQ